ncbi:MAG: S8 family serine peptidase [Clostridiales Family XIII bacterium]|jgi:subtilisin family serine protease|nr:S8 family serine peptidase [Clostridiales Family XIII bacterium]
MKRLISAILVVSLVLGLSLPTGTFSDAAEEAATNSLSKKPLREEYKAGEALVILNEENGASISALEAQVENSLPAGIELEGELDFYGEAPTSGNTDSDTEGDLNALGLPEPEQEDNFSVLKATSEEYSTTDLVAALSELPQVKYAEPNYLVYPTALTADPLSDFQWSLSNDGQNDSNPENDVNIAAIWSDGVKGSAENVIAVLDTGIDLSHPDLVNRLWTNTNTARLKGKHGYDFYSNDDNPSDTEGHGTHVAGIIGAEANNSIGISGVNQNVKIMALRFIGPWGGDLYSAIAGYEYIFKAQKLGVNVVAVNNSWGTEAEGTSGIFESVINKVGAGGCLSVAAAGNETSDSDAKPTLPGNVDSPYVINVAATNEQGELADFSNYGQNSVDLAAPGTDILSTVSAPVYNPTIYSDELQASLSTYYDGEFATSLDATYKLDGHSEDGVPLTNQSVEASDDNWFGISSGDTHSLKWEILGPEQGDVYHLYVPYEAVSTSAPVDVSIMSKITAGPDYFSDFEWGGVLLLTETKLSGTEELPEKYKTVKSYDLDSMNTIAGSGYDAPQNYWDHFSGTSFSAAKASGEKRAFVLTYIANSEDDVSINLDDIGISNAEVNREDFGKYDFYSGTSMAAPIVTGAIGLLKTYKHGGDPKQLAETLKNLVKEDGALASVTASGGVLNFEEYKAARPYIESAIVSNNQVIIKGVALGTSGEITANGKAVTPVSRTNTKITIAGKGLINHLVKFSVTSGGKTAKSTAYLVNARKAFTKVKNKLPYYNGGGFATDGKKLYYLAEDGSILSRKTKSWSYGADMVPSKMFPGATDYEKASGNLSFDSEPVYLNGKIYIIASLSTNATAEYSLVAYNTKTDKWAWVSDRPGAERKASSVTGAFSNLTHSTLAAYNGKLYYIGGYDESTGVAGRSVRVFNTKTKKWTAGPALPADEGRFLSIARQVGNKLILSLGGNDKEASGTAPETLVFNGKSWKKGARIAGALKPSALAIPVGEEAAGDEGVKEIYDSWEEISYYYKEVPYYTAAVGQNNGGLIFSGLPSDGLGDTYTYDVSSNKFKASAYELSGNIGGYEAQGIAVSGTFYVAHALPFEGNSEDEVAAGASGKATLYSIPIKTGLYKVTTAKSKGGTITGAGSYLPGASVTVSAKAKKGYKLSSFTVGGKKIKGSKSTFYITKNTKVSAKFKKK